MEEKQSAVRGKEYIRTRIKLWKPLKVVQRQVIYGGRITDKNIGKYEKRLD